MKTHDKIYVGGDWVMPSGKQSGHGRELGKFGLEEFLVRKSLQL
jgi:acyl-CoA reductase-like NAD-dependent aldehyde dehydrogenase